MTVLGGGLLIVLVSASAPTQVFRSGIDLVALTVAVTDERGHSVRGLTAEHFAVYEDGAQQQISLFGGADVPLDVALVADASLDSDVSTGGRRPSPLRDRTLAPLHLTRTLILWNLPSCGVCVEL